MIVVACPGQGSQRPGFLEPWLAVDGAEALLTSYSEVTGIDLVQHGTVSDADTIRDTAVAQPLIVAAGLLTLHALREAGAALDQAGYAGHSVGEITAAVGAGVFDALDGMRFVTTRARAMAEAAAAARTGMSAVIGGDQEAVLAAVSELGLQAANFNGGGQLVVAGAVEDLARLSEQPPAGTRVIPLQVAGAFHTTFMGAAQEPLRSTVASIQVHDPRAPLWTNADGTLVDDGQRYVELLITQLASPVRWDLCMESFASSGVTGIVEVAPAGTLTGLAKRALRGTPTVAVASPDDLPAAVELLASAG